MKLISYVRADGTESFGVLDEMSKLVLDAREVMEDRFPTLRSAIAADALGELSDRANGAAGGHPVESIRMLPPIPEPAKIFCVGLNYREHAEEASMEQRGKPVVFTRFGNSQVADGDDLVIPLESEQLDFEGELAVIIGARGRRIRAGEAMAHVAGYAAYNDASVRDWQFHTGQWAPGKNFIGTGGFGPVLVTTDEIDDLDAVTITTTVNGHVRQRARLSELIFDIPTLIEYISTFTTLEPGDVIVSGTPSGVGAFQDPPSYLADGDVVEIAISQVGTLTNRIRKETM